MCVSIGGVRIAGWYTPAETPHYGNEIMNSILQHLAKSAHKLSWLAVILCCGATPTPKDDSTPAQKLKPATTPRDYFNMGTRLLNSGKFREAEAAFETALGSQKEQLQPPTLYNLGYARFQQGLEDLKKTPGASATSARAKTASQAGADAVSQADK